MSYKSLLTGREKIITRGSLCNETTRFTLISVATESSWNWGGGRVGGEKGRGSEERQKMRDSEREKEFRFIYLQI